MLAQRIHNLLIPIAGAAALVIVVTWPLATLTGTILDWCDTLFSAWVLAWETHALTTAPSTIANANIFWPDRAALFYGPAAFGALPWFAPIYLLSDDPARAINLMLLACLTLTGAALHWVVFRWTRDHAAGFVASATFLTTPWVSRVFVPLVPHLAPLQFFPLIVLLAGSELARMRHVAVLTAMIVLQCLTDVAYVAPAVLAPVGALAVIRLARRSSRASGVRLAVAVVAAGLLLAPAVYRYAAVSAHNPDLVTQTVWAANRLSRTSLPADLVARDRPASFRPSAVAIVLLGLALTLLSGGGARALRSRPWRSALFWCLAGFVLSLGETIELGSVRFPGPQGALAAWLPTLGRVRFASRLGIASLVGFSLLAGVAFAALTASARRWVRAPLRARLLAPVLALAAAAALCSDQGPPARSHPPRRVQADVPPASFLAALARQPGPLVELPNGPVPLLGSAQPPGPNAAVFSTRQAEAMFKSIFHWHPMLNGYSSYFPAGFAERLALADLLPEPRALDMLVSETELRFVWVHLDQLEPGRRALWSAQIARGGLASQGKLRLVAREGSDLLFAVER